MNLFKYICKLIVIPVVLAAGFAWFAGCTDTTATDTGSTDIGLEIHTRSLLGNTIEGVTISSLRLIAVRLDGNLVAYNKTTLNGGLTDLSGSASLGNFIAELKPGKYSIHAIANETAAMTLLLQNAVNTQSIRNIMATVNNSESDLVMYVAKKIEIRPLGDDLSQTAAEVKEDGSDTWISSLTLSLERVGVKVSLRMRKRTTTNPSDTFSVKKVEVVQLPEYCYLDPQNYTGVLSRSITVYDNTTGMLFDNNTAPYQQVGLPVIVPEYLPQTQNEEYASIIQISATYNGTDVLYRVPIRKNLTDEDYSLYRDHHYQINLTITQIGELNYNPYVEYSVSDWTDAMGEDINVTRAIEYRGEWAGGTSIVDAQTVGVYNNGYVEYSFELINPSGSSWFASLSNGLDFMFDYSGGAVSSGLMRTEPYKIRIKPRRTVSISGVQTKFYITVLSGSDPVELDLFSEGEDTRLIVTQIPN